MKDNHPQYIFDNNIIVNVDTIVRKSEYNYFTMLVSETHQGLRPLDYLGNRQLTVVQSFSHTKEDDGFPNSAQDLSADRISPPTKRIKNSFLAIFLRDSRFFPKICWD